MSDPKEPKPESRARKESHSARTVRAKIALYRRARRTQIAGVQVTLAAGSDPKAQEATWNIMAGTLAGLIPRAGDLHRASDGIWWRVKSVAALSGSGEYPCVCERAGS